VKKLEDNRYPHSAELFRFCKEALALKHNNEVKVIDGHVGALLDFDPADCSHWKRGKKNIKSSDSLQTLSNALQVDMSLLSDLVSGRTNVESALLEYKGLGEFDLSNAKLEELRTEYKKSAQGFQNIETSLSKQAEVGVQFDKLGTVAIVNEILERADVKSCPVLIPEILACLNESENFTAQQKESLKIERSPQNTENSDSLSSEALEMSPQVRFLSAKNIGKQMLFRNAEAPAEVMEAQCNVFALNLLVPTELFQRALKQVDLSKDFVATLSEIFWVSRSVIQARLQDAV
jgi:hypothetical protein